MPRARSAAALLPAAATLMLFGASDAGAQALGSLGLSAAPDAYVARLDTPVGEPFTLYVIAAAEDPRLPLDFSLASASWAVFNVCCGGSPVEIVDHASPAGVVGDGHPYLGVVTTGDACLDQDVILLAQVTFDWVMPGAPRFALAAGATGPAIDCDGGAHFMYGLMVEVNGTGGVSAPSTSWGALKSLYR